MQTRHKIFADNHIICLELYNGQRIPAIKFCQCMFVINSIISLFVWNSLEIIFRNMHPCFLFSSTQTISIVLTEIFPCRLTNYIWTGASREVIYILVNRKVFVIMTPEHIYFV